MSKINGILIMCLSITLCLQGILIKDTVVDVNQTKATILNITKIYSDAFTNILISIKHFRETQRRLVEIDIRTQKELEMIAKIEANHSTLIQILLARIERLEALHNERVTHE